MQRSSHVADQLAASGQSNAALPASSQAPVTGHSSAMLAAGASGPTVAPHPSPEAAETVGHRHTLAAPAAAPMPIATATGGAVLSGHQPTAITSNDASPRPC